jgi:hypothetical protein
MSDYKIVGFDVRARPILDLGESKKLGDYLPTKGTGTGPFPATVSDEAWQSSAASTRLGTRARNGIGLFALPDAHYLDPSGVHVAFSIASAHAVILDSETYIYALPESLLHPALGWTLLGYDVSDDRLNRSVFYGSYHKDGLSLKLSEAIYADIDLRFNRYGLLDDEVVALRVAQAFTTYQVDEPSEYIVEPEETPNIPVRVWVQNF